MGEPIALHHIGPEKVNSVNTEVKLRPSEGIGRLKRKVDREIPDHFWVETCNMYHVWRSYVTVDHS